jgi:hypothetical protein
MLKMVLGTIGVGVIIPLLASARGIIGVGDGNIATVTMIGIGMIMTATMTVAN